MDIVALVIIATSSFMIGVVIGFNIAKRTDTTDNRVKYIENALRKLQESYLLAEIELERLREQKTKESDHAV